MAERIILTKDDFIPIDSMGSTLIGFGEEYDSKEANQLKQQILDDQEKINLLTKSELRDLPLLKVAGEQALEIKQLKEDLRHSMNQTERSLLQAEQREKKLEKIEKECDKDPKAYILASFIKEMLDLQEKE